MIFFQAEDGIRDSVASRGLGDVYKRQGRTQQKFFNPDEAENFYYFGTYDVDFNKRTDLDVKDMTAPEANKEIDNLMSQGYGTIVIKNPQGKHSLGVGILNKLNLIFEGSLGYFGMGSCDGCLLYTSPSPRDATLSRMPSSA